MIAQTVFGPVTINLWGWGVGAGLAALIIYALKQRQRKRKLETSIAAEYVGLRGARKTF